MGDNIFTAGMSEQSMPRTRPEKKEREEWQPVILALQEREALV